MNNQPITFETEIDVNELPESGFIVLEPGNYDFSVVNFTRKTSRNGNLMAEVVLRINDCDIKDYLTLTEKSMYKIRNFFKSLGMQKTSWNQITGKVGSAEIITENYTDKNGKSRQTNKVNKYIEKEINKPQPQQYNPQYRENIPF